MSNLMFGLVVSSLSGLFAISLFRFMKTRNTRAFLFHLVALAVVLTIVYSGFYTNMQLTAREAQDHEISFVVVLYLCMLLGMFSHFGYHRITSQKRKRRRPDLGLLIAPLFASPIVFLPLLAALQNADIDMQHLTATKLMVFFVAFENGFFWKEYFDNRRKEESV